jgi:hypothetical protein
VGPCGVIFCTLTLEGVYPLTLWHAIFGGRRHWMEPRGPAKVARPWRKREGRAADAGPTLRAAATLHHLGVGCEHQKSRQPR